MDPSASPNDPSGRAQDLLRIGSETRNFDVKGPMGWPRSRTKERHEIVRDILAFSNTPDGGTLIVGVERTTHSIIGMTPADVCTWDTTKVADACASFGSPTPELRVSYPEVGGKRLVMVDITPFDEIPTVCCLEATAGGRMILRKSAIYIRTLGAQTVEINDDVQMRSLIGQAINRKSEHLLAQIRALVEPPPQQASPNPYATQIAQDLTALGGLVL